MSHDQGFQKVMWLSLAMVFGPPTISVRNPKSFFLMALGHECEMALTNNIT